MRQNDLKSGTQEDRFDIRYSMLDTSPHCFKMLRIKKDQNGKAPTATGGT